MKRFFRFPRLEKCRISPGGQAGAAFRPPLPGDEATRARSFSVKEESPLGRHLQSSSGDASLFVGGDRTRSLLLKNSLRGNPGESRQGEAKRIGTHALGQQARGEKWIPSVFLSGNGGPGKSGVFVAGQRGGITARSSFSARPRRVAGGRGSVRSVPVQGPVREPTGRRMP